jgi:N-acetylneuraminate synthase
LRKIDGVPLAIAHSTSAYPCPNDKLNLRMIHTLQREFPGLPIGYSGHERGLQTSVAAAAIGATFIERHITLDRTMWGSDQAASLEPGGLQRLVRDVRVVESALGDGVKRVYDEERPLIERLRRRN